MEKLYYCPLCGEQQLKETVEEEIIMYDRGNTGFVNTLEYTGKKNYFYTCKMCRFVFSSKKDFSNCFEQ